MRAVITVEDDDMAIKLGVVFEGTPKDPGFCMGSNAHQHVAVILKMMDFIAEKREALGETRLLTDEELILAIDDVFERVRQVESSRHIDLSQVPDDSPLFQNEKDTKLKIPELLVVKH